MKNVSSRFLAVLFILTGIFSTVNAQRPYAEADIDSLKKYELKLQEIGDSLLDGSNQVVRIEAVVKFIPLLVKTLKIPGSFDYKFDSLRFMYTFTPPDKRFRLYNWNVKFDDGTFRYYGAIQVNNKERLQLIPLFDRVKDFILNPEDTILNNEEWYGAQYYQLVQNEHKKKTYYLLLGWDGYKHMSNKKVIDVLSFDENGKVEFGAPIFQIEDKLKTRMIFEFNQKAVMTLKYIASKDFIIYDHLVAPNEHSEGKFFTYIPDGTYDYLVFKKKKGLWLKEEMFFDEENSPAEDGTD